MRLAIPLNDGGQLAEEFSQAGQFAIYDLNDETRAVGYVGRQAVAEPGCGRTAAVLQGQGVEVILGHHVSEKAVNHLLEAGIIAIKDAPILSPDELVAHLVSGTLQATAPDAAMHGGGCESGGGCCCHGAEQEQEHEHHEGECCGG